MLDWDKRKELADKSNKATRDFEAKLFEMDPAIEELQEKLKTESALVGTVLSQWTLFRRDCGCALTSPFHDVLACPDVTMECISLQNRYLAQVARYREMQGQLEEMLKKRYEEEVRYAYALLEYAIDLVNDEHERMEYYRDRLRQRLNDVFALAQFDIGAYTDGEERVPFSFMPISRDFLEKTYWNSETKAEAIRDMNRRWGLDNSDDKEKGGDPDG